MWSFGLIAAGKEKEKRQTKTSKEKKQGGKKGWRRNIQKYSPMGSQSVILWPEQQPLPSSSSLFP
jgi:hypothetical protein